MRELLEEKNLAAGFRCAPLRIAVIIPAFKAALHLEKVVQGLPRQVETVIIVDDASPDDTFAVAQDLAQRFPRVVAIRHEKNQGVGGAMLTGYNAALRRGAEIMVKMDSDGQMNPEYLPAFIDTLQRGKADYAKGNRFMHYRNLSKMPFTRRIGNIGLSFLTKLASGYWNVFDPTNGYTAIWSDVFRCLDQEKIARRYFFETSMLLELGLNQVVVRDIYIPAVYRDENSSLSELDALLRFPFLLFRGFLKRIMIQYFIRDFTAVSILLLTGFACLFFGISFGFSSWNRSSHLGIPTLAGTVMIAVMPFILGVQFLLQALLLDIQNVPTFPIHRQDVFQEE